MKKLFNKVAGIFKRKPEAPETPHGYDVLRNGRISKSTAFDRKERDALGLRGLLPHAVDSLQQQAARVLEHLRRKTSDIEKYIYLSGLQERNERLFYHTAMTHIDEIMPLIYTPTVGEACRDFSHLFRNPRGLYITPDDKGHIRAMLDNWDADDVRVIVITDGQRILGLGDLGANGMGIPIGKLALYTICGGIDPQQGMPVMFDIGTNNDALRNDPLYLGYPHKRLEGAAYDALMAEFVEAVKDKFPKAVIQFEDFLTPNAYRLLDTYRDKTPCFNDDIQGTAAVALAGVYASGGITGADFKNQRVMFLGAGSAATGIADLMLKAFQDAGLTAEEARSRLSLVDSKGLVTTGRDRIEDNKKPYAQNAKPMALLEAIETLKPTVLIGATGSPGTFTKDVIGAMARLNDRPVIFALSNPTSHAECTATEAYAWSRGKAIFSSGSPFAPVDYNGEMLKPGQGNNAYIFPGLGLGAVLSEATAITDEMFLAAAKTLAGMVTAEHLAAGTLYPPLTDIREVSSKIAKAVMQTADAQNLSPLPLPADIDAYIKARLYNPAYPSSSTAKPKVPKP